MRPGLPEQVDGARYQFLDRPDTAGPQQVDRCWAWGLSALLGAVGQYVALDDRDDVRELDQGAGREHAGQAAAEDDGGLQGPAGTLASSTLSLTVLSLMDLSLTRLWSLMGLTRSLPRRPRPRVPP